MCILHLHPLRDALGVERIRAGKLQTDRERESER